MEPPREGPAPPRSFVHRRHGAALDAVNGLRDAGVPVGVSGERANVVKVRPPLTLRAGEAEIVLDRLDLVLGRFKP